MIFSILTRRLALAFLLLFGLGFTVPASLLAQDVMSMGDEEQKDWLTQFVQDRLSTPERQITLSNIEGALGSNVAINEITISDTEGVWLRVNNARLNWNQAALLLGRLEVRTLAADSIEYLRNPVPSDQVDLPDPEASTFQVPEFPVAVILEELSIPRVTFGEDVFGLGSEISLAGALTLEDGNLDTNLDIERLDGPGGNLTLQVAYSNETSEIDLDFTLDEPENGVIANLLNIEGRPAVNLTVTGSGPVSDLRADLTLQANGQTAISGTTTIAQQADGYAVNADLRGPLSTLVAETYRPFFGAETSLTASALVRSEGGFSISNLELNGGQLSLQGAVETTSDNFLRTLALNARIADPNGNPVILPVPGGQTTVNTAQLAIAFGGDQEESWNSTLAVEQFSNPGFAADSLMLTVGGVAENLSDPAARRVTFNGDGSLSGISSSEEIEAALGNSIGLGLAGLWTAGQPVSLAELRIAGDNLTTALSGQLEGLDFTGDINVETSSIAPFSGIAGRDLDGGLSLRASGSIMPLTGGFDLRLMGTGTDLAVADEIADRLLAGEVSLSGRLARTEAGITADEFRIANQQLQLTADGTYSNALADFGFNLNLSDLALLSDQASGALAVQGTARTDSPDSPIALELVATVPQGRLAGRNLTDARVAFTGNTMDGNLTGNVSGDASLDGYRASLAAGVGLGPENQSLSDLTFEIAGTRISGSFVRQVANGLVDGTLSVAAPDVSLAAALLLLEAEGSINATVALRPANETQSAQLQGDVSGLLVNGIRVGAADFNAQVADLFGVPQVNGSVNASNIAAAGVDIDTLTATASQNGSTTQFDGQAALATGTDVSLAGALTPIEGGYRLALNRADLVQGELSARLSQPTELQVMGSSVALDAVRFDVGSGSITATGTAGDTLDIQLAVNALPLSIANTVSPDLGLAGTLSGNATITGRGSDPQVQFEAEGQGISAAAIDGYGITPLTATARGSFADGTVNLAALSANGAGGLNLSGSGTIPLTGAGLDVAVTGSAPLALGNQFVADRGGQLSGALQLDARVTGSIADPQFGGSVSTSGAGYVDPELNLRLVGITGSASLSGTNLTINSLTAGLATGGSVSASGTIGLTGNLPANVRLALNSARYADGNLFVATVSGNLALTGPITANPVLGGDLFVEEANITVPSSFGNGAQLIDVDHVRTPPAVAQTLARARIDDRSGAPIPQTRPAGVLLDINLNAPNQIFIRGRGLDAEVGGSVRLTGPVNNIQPVGGFELIRGRLNILGQRITFESGTVTLVGDLDPFIDLRASTASDDITVFVTVSGRVSDIDVDFSSNPSLPQDEVLARLIFNRSMGDLSPLQLARLAGAAGELVGGGGGGLVDSLRGAAGLADLDVTTDAQGNVAVQAGTYIQDNVYLGVSAGANGQSRVTINLDVTEDLKVQGAAGQGGESSLGLYYERDY